MTRIEAIKNVLSSQEFLDVISELRQSQLDKIVYSNANEQEVRESSYNRIQAINEIMSTLESIAQTGEIKDKAWKIL